MVHCVVCTAQCTAQCTALCWNARTQGLGFLLLGLSLMLPGVGFAGARVEFDAFWSWLWCCWALTLMTPGYDFAAAGDWVCCFWGLTLMLTGVKFDAASAGKLTFVTKKTKQYVQNLKHFNFTWSGKVRPINGEVRAKICNNKKWLDTAGNVWKWQGRLWMAGDWLK